MIEAGVDEAGRGALAGPVVAACVILNPESDNSDFKDSKTLSPDDRLELSHRIKATATQWTISVLSHRAIDKHNIFQATMKAMAFAVNRLTIPADIILIDGNKVPKNLPYKATAIVGGDGKVQCIAAASIIAKVTRDQIMDKLDMAYPGYGLGQHKGYATKTHYDRLFEKGPAPIHRRSFRLSRQESLFGA